MDTLVLEIEKIPLSGQDLVDQSVKMGNPNVRWMFYDDLSKFRHIDEVFMLNRQTGWHKYNTVYLLLEIRNHSQSTVGHWIALIIDSEKNFALSYYDPYALTIEQDLMVTGEKDLLTNLLSGMYVDVNSFQHQKFKNEVQVCGRHTVVRGLFHFYTNKQYNDVVIAPLIKTRQVCDADTLVSLLTAFLSKSDEVVRMFFKKKASSLDHSPVDERHASLPSKGLGMGGSVI